MLLRHWLIFLHPFLVHSFFSFVLLPSIFASFFIPSSFIHYFLFFIPSSSIHPSLHFTYPLSVINTIFIMHFTIFYPSFIHFFNLLSILFSSSFPLSILLPSILLPSFQPPIHPPSIHPPPILSTFSHPFNSSSIFCTLEFSTTKNEFSNRVSAIERIMQLDTPTLPTIPPQNNNVPSPSIFLKQSQKTNCCHYLLLFIY